MVKNSCICWIVFCSLFSLFTATTVCQFAFAAGPQQATQDQAPSESTLKIVNEGQLPDTFPHASYQLRFIAHGGVPPLHWKVEKGVLPPGLKLEDDGSLHGQAERTGEFQFTVSAGDSNQPSQIVQKEFLLRVRAALTLVWKNPARVNGNRIEGSVVVSNTTADDMDLTFVVMAVADNGRATAIGYQRFNLAHGTVEKELPFGESLPHGAYVVHVDAVGEVAARNLIYRERMQPPGPLQVTVGP
jgi:hypothetical protein